MMHGWGWNGMMGGWGLGGGIFTFLLAAALIVGGILLYRRYQDGDGGSDESGLSAEEALKMRYVRGEIDREEYQRIRADLENRSEGDTP